MAGSNGHGSRSGGDKTCLKDRFPNSPKTAVDRQFVFAKLRNRRSRHLEAERQISEALPPDSAAQADDSFERATDSLTSDVIPKSIKPSRALNPD